MLTRRRVLGYSAVASTVLTQRRLLPSAAAQALGALRLAIIGNTYHYGSELQTIADRFLVGYAQDGDWHIPKVKVVSMYVESRSRSGPGSGRQRTQGAPPPQQDAAPLGEIGRASCRERV